MSKSEFPQPSPEDLAEFIKGDPVATDRIMRCVAVPLCRWAWQQYPALPRDEVEHLVFESLAETAHNHARYDPTRSLITTYIIHLIRWRVQRFQQRQQKKQAIEADEREKPSHDAYNRMDSRKNDSRIMRERFFETVRGKLTGLDRTFFELMVEGAEPAAYIREVEQAGFEGATSEAKNRKARVTRRLKEIANLMELQLEDLME